PSQNGCERHASRRDGQHCAEVFRETDGEGGDSSALADGKDHPSVEKCWKLTVGLAQEYVLPAGLREHRGHLGEGETREQGDNAADEPDAEEEQRSVHG